MPNALAYLVLLIYPAVAATLFVRLPPARALIWSLLLAYLFLPPAPAGFDFPLMPPITKDTLPNITVFIACLLLIPGRLSILPQNRIARALMLLFILSPIATVLTNREPVSFVIGELPGLRITDALALSINQAILLLGFMMARPLLQTAETQRDLLAAIFICGMVYSFPMLVEVRLSPQINLWVYGYYQHLFEQSMRGGGFRPVVFLFHGIWVSFFAMTAALAAFALWRNDRSKSEIFAPVATVISDQSTRVKFGAKRLPLYVFAAFYLIGVLILTKTLAPLLYFILLAPLICFATSKTQMRIAIVLAFVAFTYPMLKGADIVPSQAILAQAEKVSAERANSLKFRFENEDRLLERAREKPLFGWGSWGRNHLHNAVDGTILTVTDGRWIITYGVYGWLGYLAEFGLLSIPLLLLWREARIADPKDFSNFIGPLSLMLAINLFDLLPNATLTPITWIISGALLGYAEHLRRIRLVEKQPAFEQALASNDVQRPLKVLM